MPTPQRTTVEMLIAVLATCETLTKPTHVMMRCNMGWTPLLRYIDYLISKGLMEKVDGAKLSKDLYAQTDKRTKFMLQTTMKGKLVLSLIRDSELGLLFGYAKWLEERG